MNINAVIQSGFTGIILPILGCVVVFGAAIAKKQGIVMSALIAAIFGAVFVFGAQVFQAIGPAVADGINNLLHQG